MFFCLQYWHVVNVVLPVAFFIVNDQEQSISNLKSLEKAIMSRLWLHCKLSTVPSSNLKAAGSVSAVPGLGRLQWICSHKNAMFYNTFSFSSKTVQLLTNKKSPYLIAPWPSLHCKTLNVFISFHELERLLKVEEWSALQDWTISYLSTCYTSERRGKSCTGDWSSQDW